MSKKSCPEHNNATVNKIGTLYHLNTEAYIFKSESIKKLSKKRKETNCPPNY